MAWDVDAPDILAYTTSLASLRERLGISSTQAGAIEAAVFARFGGQGALLTGAAAEARKPQRLPPKPE